MDFGQDLEPEELTNHYDQCYNPQIVLTQYNSIIKV